MPDIRPPRPRFAPSVIGDRAHHAVTGRQWPTWLWFAAAMVPFAIVAGVHWPWPPPAKAGDYAQYLSHARALAEGRAYGDIGYIYNPAAWFVGPPNYPPGLPLTLTPLVFLVGVDSVLFRVFGIAALMLFAWLAWRALSRHVEPYQAAIGVGFAALAIESALGTLVPISDLPFAALLWLFVLVVDRPERWAWSRVAAVTALGFVLLSYRAAAAAIVPAIAVYGLVQWRRDRGRSLLPVLAWSVAGVVALAAGLRNPYKDGLSPITTSLGTQLEVVERYVRVIVEAELNPFGVEAWDNAYHVAASLLIAAGALLLAWRLRRSFLLILVATYVALLASVPAVDERYVWPLLPLVGVSLALAMETALRRFTPSRLERVARPSVVVLCSLVVVGATWHAASMPRPFSIVGTRDADALYAWLARADRSSSMRLVFENPRVVTLETRVPAMAIPSHDADDQLAAIDEYKITHVITMPDDVSTENQRTLNRLTATVDDRFELVYANPGFRVYRVARPPG